MSRIRIIAVVVVVVFSFLILLLAGGLTLSKKIEKELKRQDAGAYVITSTEVKVNLLSRRILLRNLEIKDTINRLHVVVPETAARGIRIFPLIFGDRFIAGGLHIDKPQLTLIRKDENVQEEPEDVGDSDTNNILEHGLIKNLSIGEATILLQDQNDSQADTVLYFKADLHIQDLSFNEVANLPLHDDFAANRVRVQFKDAVYFIPGDIYKITTDSIGFDTDNRILTVDNLLLTSLHQKYETGQITGVETDWYHISLPKINFHEVNIEALHTDTAVVFRKAVLENLDAHIFRDKRNPFPEKPDTKLPMDMLNQLPVKFHSDSVIISQSQVVYEEHSENSFEPGMVSFTALYASIYNLSTHTDSIKGQTGMSARAMVMNEALLEAEFRFPNNKYPLDYSVTGTLATVGLPAFNIMLIPSAHVEVEKGHLKQLSFNFSYDEHVSDGKILMEYENLNINILDPEDGSSKKLKTFITETFVLRQNNLEEKNSFNEGTISFERDTKRSIFNYWWKSLFSGIKDVLMF